MSLTPWWNELEFPRFGYTNADITEWATQALAKRALQNNTIVIRRAGKGVNTKSTKELVADVTALGCRIVIHSPPDNMDDGQYYYLFWNAGAVYLAFQQDDTVRWTSSFDDSVVDCKVSTLFNESIVPMKSGGKVYTIRNTPDGMDIVSMGRASNELEFGNYEDSVIKDVKHIIEEYKASEPCGRLCVFNGKPGTGKTYLIRGLLKEVPNALFITIPPNMMAKFANPEFIPMLMDIKRRDRKIDGPIILIIEDADEVLVPRGSDNMDSISSVLNLTDGIMGHLFDLRILATTNAKKTNLDEALLRSGRLCRRIDVGPLSPLKAVEVYKRLTGKLELPSTLVGSPLCLADIYKLAREDGWVPPPRNSTMGFKADEDDFDFPAV
jgi:hypothetical protein